MPSAAKSPIAPDIAHRFRRTVAARVRSWGSGGLALATAMGSTWMALAVDESRLPAPVTNRVDFVRDIQPLLEAHCLKCHGPQRPRSGFRVDDREKMLTGGENGVAVVPGQSGKSALIHYVAGLVPDMEMPPPGKGEPLSAAEIALLRGWIDQGVPWGGVAPTRTIVDLSPTARWITVDGNERKFRELEWMNYGGDGGLERFLVQQQLGPDRQVSVRGHALRDDFQVRLSLEHADRTFVRAGVEQYRKWFSDQGGYYRDFTPPVASLDHDLFLDLGRAWIEAGGILPNGLQLGGGYEYSFKEGEKSMTQWLPATQTLPAGDVTRSVLPTAKQIDEQVHVLHFDAVKEWSKARLQDRFRYEYYELETRHVSVLDAFPSTIFSQRIRETDDYHHLANSLLGEILPMEWLLASAGYLYRRLDGTTEFGQRPVDAAGQPGFGLLWNTRGIPIEQSAHVFNANVQLGSWQGLTVLAGVQAEWNRQESLGRVSLDETDPLDPSLVVTNPASVQGDYDRFTAEEHFGARFSGIPFTLIYGEAKVRQERISQFESQVSDNGAGHGDFLRDTDGSYDWQQYRAGFSVSPWSRISFNTYYQRRDRDDEFDHQRDERPVGTPGAGYPAFITARDTESDELAARLVLRPLSWLKTTLSYRVVATDFSTQTDATTGGPDATPGGWIMAGNSDAHIYSINATLTPWRRLYLFTTFAFQDTRTVTADNFSQAVVPFRGQIYSLLTSANYIVGESTDVYLSYDFSHADYSQDNQEFGLPLGIDYQRHGVRTGLGRRFWKRFVARAEYGWFYYDEPSSGNFGDYVGHGVFATLNVRWD